MTVLAKIRFSSIATIILGIVFVVVMLFLVLKLHQSYQKEQFSQKITEASFQMALLRSEYFVHPSEMSKTQWITTYEALSRTLDEAEHLFLKNEEKALFDDTRRVSTDARALFGQLAVNIEQGGNEMIREELINQLIMKAQAPVSNVLRLSVLSRSDADRALYLFEVVVTILMFFICIITIWSYKIGRSIGQSLQALGEGTKIIASGNLDHKLKVKSQDVFGILAELFNTMATKLKESHLGLEEKVKERTAELIKKKTELERVNKFMVGRELKMKELKEEIKKLQKQ